MFVRTKLTALLLCGLLALAVAPSVYSQAGSAQPREDVNVCTVNGKAITEAQVMDEIDRVMARSGSQVAPQMKDQAYILYYEDSVKRLTQFLLLEQRAEELKLEADTADVDKFVEQIKAQAKTEEVFQSMLKQRDTTEIELRKDYAKQLVMQKVLEAEVKEPADPTDDACKAFYDENQQYFQTPEQVKASHILLSAEENATDEAKAGLKKELAEIRKKIESGELTFADAAKAHSSCPSAAQGGDLSWFGRGQMVKPFEESAFGMKKGDMSQIVETQFGYHLIQLDDKRAEGTTPLEEVKPQIVAHLKNQAMQENVQSYVESLEEKAEIKTVMSDEEWKKRHAAKSEAKPQSSQQLKLTPDELK